MVLPAPVLLIKFLGFLQGVGFVKAGKTFMNHHLSKSDIVGSYIASPWILGAYRLIMFLFAFTLGVLQIIERGPIAFTFFTVWNWWCLTLFFFLATIASAQELFSGTTAAATGGRGRQRHTTRRGVGDDAKPANLLGKIVVTLYHIAVPMTFVVDSLTWFVLVPMLLKSPDPEKVQKWKALFFCFSSYMQHGFNAIMALGELSLNRIPVSLYWVNGCVGIWGTIYGMWNVTHYVMNGRHIYPFLNAHRPYAWMAYVGLNVVFWIANALFYGLVKGKERMVLSFGGKEEGHTVVAVAAAGVGGGSSSRSRSRSASRTGTKRKNATTSTTTATATKKTTTSSTAKKSSEAATERVSRKSKQSPRANKSTSTSGDDDTSKVPIGHPRGSRSMRKSTGSSARARSSSRQK